MKHIITKEKLERYISITEKALEIAKKSIVKDRKDEGSEIIKIAGCYVSDACHFKDKEDFVNSFAAINYAHGWLDTGSRLGIFLVKDSRLFVIK